MKWGCLPKSFFDNEERQVCSVKIPTYELQLWLKKAPYLRWLNRANVKWEAMWPSVQSIRFKVKSPISMA